MAYRHRRKAKTGPRTKIKTGPKAKMGRVTEEMNDFKKVESMKLRAKSLVTRLSP